jgi:cytochrome c peroxidase
MKACALLVTIALVGCSAGAEPAAEAELPFEWQLPPGFPKPYVPADNKMSTSKVELGRRLFYDPRLSVSGEMSCATCHRQELAFTDGLARPSGATGEQVARSSMSLVNVAYYYPYTWENPKPHTLEQQALIPLFGEAPIEMGFGLVREEVMEAMKRDETYASLFSRAFPELTEPFTDDALVKALAAFQRTIISGDSPFDRYAYGGEEDALSPDAKLGFELFNTERFECYHCHAGLNFTTAFRAAASKSLGKDYQNNGLYDLDGEGSYPAESPGLVALSNDPTDRGKFRVPTLRNVAVTAPYMHDGSIATLDDVLAHYAAGGRAEGRTNPNKSQFVRGFSFEAGEKEAFRALLESLTDESVLRDARFSDPW